MRQSRRRSHLSIVEDEARDARTFEKYYRENYQRVYGYVYTIALNHDDTEEIVSEAFLKAARLFANYDSSRASFGTWVCTIARNITFDLMRKRKRRNEWTESELDADLARIAGEEEEVTLDEGDDVQLAEKLLACLSEEERELVYLKFYREMQNKEIAVAMNMNASTVSTKLSRAIARMRKAAS